MQKLVDECLLILRGEECRIIPILLSLPVLSESLSLIWSCLTASLDGLLEQGERLEVILSDGL